MAPRFGADFSTVRIHTTPQAAELASELQARAFTYRNHVFFGRNEFRPDTADGQALIAHELTHTLQQSDVIQRQSDDSPSALDKAAGFLQSAWNDITDFSESVGWRLVHEFAPSLEPILRSGPDGIFGWLKDRAGAAVDGLFKTVTAPVRALGGAGQQLAAQFQPLIATVQGAAGKIARNDCSPLREAAAEVEHVATQLITPVIEKVQPVVAAVKKVAGDLWDKVGAPVVDFIKEYAAEKWQEIQTVWDAIKSIASAIWDKTAWARDLIDKAWTWLKNKLGIGEGAEGQNGLLQWAERKLDSAWTWLKNLLAPFSRQLTMIGTAVGGVLIALSPAGPVLAIGAAVAGAAKGLQWISAHWGQGNAIVQARVYLEKTLIPPLVGAAGNLSATITRMAGTITGALHSLAAGVAGAAHALGGDLLAAIAEPIQWVADQIAALADWATGELAHVAQGLTAALNGLQSFLQNMLEFFAKLGGVALDIYTLPVFLAGKVWNWIPACIRDPVVDFLGPLILRQVELFSELAKDNDAWQRTKAEIANYIKLVIQDHDLIGAIKAAFRLVLRVFNLPPELLVTVLNKAMNAWDTISKKPLDFLKNTVRSLARGFGLMWKNFKTHLQFGLEGWLFGELAEKNISPPASWTDPKALFFFVLDVLGLSVAHVFDLLKQRFPPEKVEAVRTWYGRISTVADWINRTIDVNKSPAENTRGLIDQAKDFGKSILTDIATWVTVRVGEELALLATSIAASAGLSEVLDIARRIYKALVTAKRWARQLVDMANNTLDNVLDIASGAVDKVGTKFEGILHQGMPVVIGFLADQVGLGGIGEEMRSIVDKLRAQVDKAILWLIDKVKAALDAVVGLVKAGVAAVTDWWRAHKEFVANDGRLHELSFEGSGASATLMIASASKVPLLEQIRLRREALSEEQPRPEGALSALGLAESKLQSMYGYIREEEARTAATPAGPATAAIRDEIGNRLGEIQPLLVKGRIIVDNAQMPLTNVTYQMEGGKAKKVRADPLTINQGNTTGQDASSSSASPAGWEVANYENSTTFGSGVTSTGRPRMKRDWRRVHLISAEYHGPAIEWNLVSARSIVNTAFLAAFETTIKQKLKTTEMKLEVQVNYYTGRDDVFQFTYGSKVVRSVASDYPESFTVSLQEKTASGDFTYLLQNERISGTPLPDSESASPEEALDLTMKHLQEAMMRYLNDPGPGPLLSWGAYYPNSIRLETRNRLGAERMQQLREFYNQALAARRTPAT